MSKLNSNDVTLLSRFGQMLAGWGAVGVVYTAAGLLQGTGVVLPETALDHMIPFNPAGIWLYLSFFLLVPYAYFTVDAARLPWLRRAMQLCALVCGLVFFLWPTTLHYPASAGDGISGAALRLLLVADSSQNCLPSLHAALTLLCAWALFDGRAARRSWLVTLWGVGICFAIIQLRRHTSIDLAAGLAVAMACGWICLRRPASRRGLQGYSQ
jgi:membrane-associated phospholipid phosphatase